MIIEAILKINPKAVVSVSGDKLDTCTIEWLEGTTEISKADIQAKINETEYQRNRAKEYPSIKDQLDKIYHDGIDEWKKLIKITKDKYPKG
jgi:hypothetical protein|tara:strand:- start:50 stop:322 length:273 start_codon:yes stop_codon:yes gene_type:complete